MHYEADSQVADVTLKQGVQLLWAQIRLARRFHTIEFVFTLLVSTERGPFKYSCSSAASRPSTSIGLIALAIVCLTENLAQFNKSMNGIQIKTFRQASNINVRVLIRSIHTATPSPGIASCGNGGEGRLPCDQPERDIKRGWASPVTLHAYTAIFTQSQRTSHATQDIMCCCPDRASEASRACRTVLVPWEVKMMLTAPLLPPSSFASY